MSNAFGLVGYGYTGGVASYTGDTSLKTSFQLPRDPGGKTGIAIFVNGEWQSRANYSVNGLTLTLSFGLAPGMTLDVLYMGLAAPMSGSLVNRYVETYTANANQDTFTLSNQYAMSCNAVMCYVNGFLETNITEVDNHTIKFGQALNSGDEVDFVITVANPLSPILAVNTQYNSSRNVADKLGDIVSVKDFGAKGDGSTDDTAAIQNAINAAVTNGFRLLFNGNFLVSNVLISGVNGLIIEGDGTLTGLSTGSYSSVLEIVNSQNITIYGSLTVSASYNTGYTSGVLIHSTTGSTSYIDITNLSVVKGQQAWIIGDAAHPDQLCSEINIRGGYTYGCPSVLLAIGTQTVVNISTSNLISGYDGGNTAWQALIQKTIVSVGSCVNITGGELMHTVLSSGSLCEVQAIASTANGNQFGKISVVNVICEPACPIATTSNPNNVTSPTGGELKFVGCNAAHTQNGFAFVQTDATFLGRLVFKENNFHCSVARTQPNIQCGANCNVYCDDVSFGTNFESALAGITGGIVHFPHRMVLNVNNLNAEAINNNAATNLIFTSVVNAGDLARFTGAYDHTTGKFTVPAGGLKNIRIQTQWLLNGLAGEWYIQINGTSYGVGVLQKYNQLSYNIDSLNAGDVIQIVSMNTGGAFNAGSATTDWLQIFASN